MPNELLTMGQKRTAIERGLSQYLTGIALERVLSYWEQEYGDKPSFVLNRFLSEVCNTDELRFYRKDMLRQVLFEISEVEKQVLLQVKPQEKQEALVSGQLSDAFAQFVAYVVKGVVQLDFADFDQDVKQRLTDLGYVVVEQAAIHEVKFISDLPITSYSRVITTVYEVYCEFYGPSKADFVFARAKEQIKQQFMDVDLHQLI
ncbi:hypothetical protein [Acinetobacter sp. ANC 4178]|uniref:hypothetical protein n=1 Tax=Acinetobacter sp. ANC 4178 TaxID=2529839 RepID=UPI00103D0CC6|nr:hypothetical protein [Acinetobacter sp. ANC 4178]TCB67492.1 hypothetical protein E0H87_04640 [Acinetobacter sp. ANC 4178]